MRTAAARGAALIYLWLALHASPASADPPSQALGLVGGGGIFEDRLDHKSYFGLAYDHDWDPAWASRLPGSLYLETDLARWRGCYPAGCGTVIDAGLTPVFRWEIGNIPDTWYEEIGIGAHVIDHTRIGPQVYSTAFQFGEFAGLGCRVGDDGRYDLELRIMHESNADFKIPNDGMTFMLLRAAMRW